MSSFYLPSSPLHRPYTPMPNNTSAPPSNDPAVPVNQTCPQARRSAPRTDAAETPQPAPITVQTPVRPAEAAQHTSARQRTRQHPNTRQLQAIMNRSPLVYTDFVPWHLLCTCCKEIPNDPVSCRTCSTLFCARCWTAPFPFPPKCKCVNNLSSPPVELQQAERAVRVAIAQLEVVCNQCE